MCSTIRRVCYFRTSLTRNGTQPNTEEKKQSQEEEKRKKKHYEECELGLELIHCAVDYLKYFTLRQK